jgi:hypothetical protein
MCAVSPVTHSVANTVKRSILIWLSVSFFGNAVTWASIVGTGMVVGGVLAYNWSLRHHGSSEKSHGSPARTPTPSSDAIVDEKRHNEDFSTSIFTSTILKSPFSSRNRGGGDAKAVFV